MKKGYVTLMNVAYVPIINFNLFSLHTVLAQETAVMNSAGTHVLGGVYYFPEVRQGQILLPLRYSRA